MIRLILFLFRSTVFISILKFIGKFLLKKATKGKVSIPKTSTSTKKDRKRVKATQRK